MAVPTSSRASRGDQAGIALCLLSACGFGAMAIFAKDAYAAGAGVVTLLTVRFVIAAAMLWAIAAARGRLSTAGAAMRTPRRVVWGALVLGGAAYAAQAGLFYGALTRLDASLTSLLLYTYPAVVFVAALVLGRERPQARRVGALALGTGGAALVLLGGAAGGGLDAAGVAMALGAAVTYATYILVSDRVLTAIDPVVLAALICTGAAVTFAGAGLGSGSLDLALGARGWLDVAGLAVVCTVLPISAFFAGLRRVGPATASIASTIEPVVTVGLAMALFGERLGSLQAVGGALVVSAVVLLSLRIRVRGHDAPALPARGPAARTLASEPA